MRWVFRIVLVLVLAIVAMGAALFLLPADRIAQVAASQFESATGRQINVGGNVRASFWPTLGVRLTDVSVENVDWSDRGPLITAESLDIAVDPSVLWGGEVQLKRAEFVAPHIILETSADGRVNWEFGSEVESDAGGLSFTLGSAEIKNGRLTWLDHASGLEIDLTAIDALVTAPDRAGVASVSFSSLVREREVNAQIQVTGLEAALSGGLVPMDITTEIGGNGITFSGKAGFAPAQAQGELIADLSKPDAIYRVFGLAAPEIPAGFGQQINITSGVTYTSDNTLSLRNAHVRLDQNALAGDLDVSFANKPKVTARLAADALDFSSLMGGESETQSSWSTDKIDVSALHNVDANISLNASAIDIGLTKLGASRALITLENGRAVTELKGVEAFKGTLTGSIVVNARGGLSSRVNVAASQVDLQSLLGEIAGFERLVGTGALQLNVLAVGNSMDALMNSLDGSGSLKVGKGEIKGFDLDAMIQNLDPSFARKGASTIFNSLSGSFGIKEGVLNNSDLLAVTPLLNVGGNGAMDIGGQSLDYVLTAKMVRENLQVPVSIKGPWSAPKFRLDIAAMAEQNLRDEVEEVITNRIAEEIGVEAENLDNIEDALKEAAEDRVKKALEDRLKSGLGGLLGGN